MQKLWSKREKLNMKPNKLNFNKKRKKMNV